VTGKVWMMCDRLVGIANVHHNQTNEHLQHFVLMELSSKGNIKGT